VRKITKASCCNKLKQRLTEVILYLVLSQEIVSTPGAEIDREIIKNKRLEETNIIYDIRIMLF
jgi:hypothetical protein